MRRNKLGAASGGNPTTLRPAPPSDATRSPTCLCAEFWPGKGHHPECPVRKEIEKLKSLVKDLWEMSFGKSPTVADRNAMFKRLESMGLLGLWESKEIAGKEIIE